MHLFNQLSQNACYKVARVCDGCGLIRPCKLKRMKGLVSETQFLCKHCSKVHKTLFLNFIPHECNFHFFIDGRYRLTVFLITISTFILFTVTKIRAVLWHMQEYLAPFR